MSVLEMAGAVGIVCGAFVALLTVLEKVTGVGNRWLSKGVREGTAGLRADVNDVKVDVRTVQADLEGHRNYTRYHLGPNGDSPRLHERVARIEEQLGKVEKRGE